MIDIDKIVSSKWGLPVEQALRVEALSHNMRLVHVQTELSLRKMLSGILGDVESVNRIMGKPPFISVKDQRFQISITYWFHIPIWEIEARGLEGDENTIFSERAYWNWYSIEEEAIEKYEEKLALLRDDPCSYADPGCMGVKFARIRLTDTAYERILKEKYFRI